MPASSWTRERDADLARWYMAGEPVDQIAAVLGCTVSMVTTRVGTLGLRRRRLKGGEERAGNEAWVIIAALCQAVPIDPGPFAEDLLEQLR
jgi:hypothetical protein